MKMSTILRYATTVLGVTGAISRKSRERGRFELHASHNATDDDKAPAQNKTTILSENSTETSHKEFIQMFDFIEANVYNNSRSDAEKGWVIPVSHAACTNWDLSTSEIRITVQMTIDWSNGGGKVVPRNFHKEIHGVAALYLCNCKWDWFDRAPRSEMAEFYERLVDMCGNGQSGWIFSKKWEKGYAVATKNYVLLPPTRENLCPPRCLGSGVMGEECGQGVGTDNESIHRIYTYMDIHVMSLEDGTLLHNFELWWVFGSVSSE